MKLKRLTTSAACLTVIMLTGILSSAAAQTSSAPEDDNYFWNHPEEVTVTPAEMAFTLEEFAHIKNQSVFVMARFDNGWVLIFSYFWVKGGFANQWGIYVGVADPEGNGYFFKEQLKNRNMKFSEEELYISDGENIIRGGENFYNFRIDIEGFSCNLNYLNILPPWKPGTGVDYFDKEKTAFDRRAVISPWAEVQGFIDVDGKIMDVTGQGFAEKQMTINTFVKLNPLTYSLRLFSPAGTPDDERWHIGILENYTHEDYGKKRLPRLTAAKGREWVLTTMDYEILPEDFKDHPDLPHQYPVKLNIRSEDDGYIIDGTFYATDLFNITDIIGELPKFIQAFVLLFMDRPVYFRLLGEFYGSVTYPDGTRENLHLYGPYEYIVVR